MKIVTANIGRNIGTAGVKADMRKIKDTLPLAVVGWQEIDEADPANEHALLSEVFANHELVHFKSRVPISVPKRFKIVKEDAFRVSPGVERTSPPRWVTEVWIQTKHSDKPIVIMNFHLIAGAWNKKIEANQELRRDTWWDAVNHIKRRIAWHNAAGRTVVWMGDTNRMDMVKLHKDEKRLVTEGIDSISVVEGEVKVKLLDKGNLDLNSDHPARWVKVELSSRRNLTSK